ncbi:MAG: Ni/Fe-hydrogenase cytochrome b subunit [Ignavibacteria bacterium]|nr:Ni/Fe-hydrogenase cytochrome b subunit [Ignavibacteria bacterium]
MSGLVIPMKRLLSKLTFWKVVAGLVLISGACSAAVRYLGGLGAATNLTDEFPWGLWIGFDVLCGVGLAAGGFTLAGIVYIFNVKRFEPIIRPTILTAFLGYLLVILALMFDLGRPLQIWHAIIMWNPRSVMFEVAWCVMLYTTVLALEFSPVVMEKLKMTRTMKVIKKITIPLIIAGVLLSTLHQSSLGSLYLIIPEKLYGLWYSPYLPVFFFVSAISVGCAMVIFESLLSSHAFNRGLELDLLSEIGKVAVVGLAVYLTMKVVDLADRHALSLLWLPRMETYLYWLEMVVGVIAPLLLLSRRRVRESRNGLFLSAVMVIVGFVLNRMNVSITGLEAWAGASYFPSWMEISVTVSIVAAGFVLFAYGAKYLPLFKQHPKTVSIAPSEAEWLQDLKTVSQPS